MLALKVIYAAVAFGTATVVVFLCFRWMHLSKVAGYKKLSARTYVWGFSYAILPLVFGVLVLMGLYKGSPLAPFLLAAGVIFCTIGVLHRENGKTFITTVNDFLSTTIWNHGDNETQRPRRLFERFSARHRKRSEARAAKRRARREARGKGDKATSRASVWWNSTFRPWAREDLSRLAVAAIFSFLSLEMCWHLNIIGMNFLSLVIDILIILFAMLAMYFLFQRRNWGAIAVALAAYVIGIIEYFVIVLKGSVITAGDIYALSTAEAVSDGLSFDFGGTVLLGAIWFDLALLALARISPVVRRAYASPVTGPEAGAEERKGGVVTSAEEDGGDGKAGKGSGSDVTAADADAKAAADGGQSSPSPRRKPHAKAHVGRVCVNVLLACVCAFGAWGSTYAAYGWTQLLGTKFWQAIVAYEDHGFLTSFFSMWYGMPIAVPDGYSTSKAESLEKDLAEQFDNDETYQSSYSQAAAQFAEVKPNVIFVMNETFSDLSKFYDLSSTGYTGPSFFNSISDTLMRGTLDVSVVGGGTCNSEFEFLTGDSMAYVGLGKYPYNLYNFSEVDSLAKQFKSIGYDTTAIHPNLATNWNRDKVYPELGFDTFLSIDDFEGAPTFHNGVTDRATYEKVLEIIESSDTPQFISDVTMQNHTGYDTGNIPLDRLTDYTLEGESDYNNATFNEYVSCIQASDEDLAYLISELRQLDEPTVLVFFGDHQPNIVTNWLNDDLYPDEDSNSLEHQLRTFRTQYFIWANYDVAGNSQTSEERETSINYLNAYLMELIGAPLSDHQKASLEEALEMPSVTLMGYCDTEGNWTETNSDDGSSSASSDAYYELSLIQYLEFGAKVKQ